MGCWHQLPSTTIVFGYDIAGVQQGAVTGPAWRLLGRVGVRWVFVGCSLGCTGVNGLCRFCGGFVQVSSGFCEGHQPRQQTASLLFEQGCLLVIKGPDGCLNAVKCSATHCGDVQCVSLDFLSAVV